MLVTAVERESWFVVHIELGGRRQTRDLDVLPDVLNSLGERESCDDRYRFVCRQDTHGGELGIVPGHRIEFA